MEADKILTAYSGLSIAQSLVLGSFIVIIVSVIVWLIANYGLTFKNFTIGGSKKILNASRHDSFLKDDLKAAIDRLDKNLMADIKTLIKKKKHELLKNLNCDCFFLKFNISYSFEEILIFHFYKNDFYSSVTRRNRRSMAVLVYSKLVESLKDNEYRLKSSPCSIGYPEPKNSETLIRRMVLEFIDEIVVLGISTLEKKIKIYDENKNLFEDPFFKEHVCDRKAAELKAILESIE